MTDDQAARIAEMQERLLETVIREADPGNWTGGDTMTRDLTTEDRGNRYWCLKVASQAVSLFAKLEAVIEGRTAASSNAGEKGRDVDDEIRAAEREAKKILKRVQDGMTKRNAKA